MNEAWIRQQQQQQLQKFIFQLIQMKPWGCSFENLITLKFRN